MNTRIQFEMSEDKVRELQHIMDLAGIITRRDLFNNALAAFQWLIDEKRSGRTIASIDEKKGVYKELVMPVFANAAVRAATVAEASALEPEETTNSDIKEKELGATLAQSGSF